MLWFYLAAIADEDGKKTFEYYYVTYRRAMFLAANAVLHHESDAEDAVHNAFLGIVKHPDVLLNAEEAQGKNYCIKAARNAALTIVRKNGTGPLAMEDEALAAVPDEKAFEELIEQAEYQDLLSEIENLDAVYRDVLYLHYVMDMPVKKIADVLDRKLSTVKQQLVRGKKSLIAALKKKGAAAYGK